MNGIWPHQSYFHPDDIPLAFILSLANPPPPPLLVPYILPLHLHSAWYYLSHSGNTEERSVLIQLIPCILFYLEYRISAVFKTGAKDVTLLVSTCALHAHFLSTVAPRWRQYRRKVVQNLHHPLHIVRGWSGIVRCCTVGDHRVGIWIDSGSSLKKLIARCVQHFPLSSTFMDDFRLIFLFHSESFLLHVFSCSTT